MMLKRLSSASSTAGWGQSFGYDGFGNLTSKTASSGTPPVATYATDPATNRLSGTMYDSNGNQLYANSANLLYDVSNRMTTWTGSSTQGLYEYDASNRRVNQVKQSFNGSIWVTNINEYYFYGIEGKKYGTYVAPVTGSGSSASMSWTLQTTQVFFRGKLVQVSGTVVQTDKRGSVGSYYPYGEDRTSTPNDVIKFATYTRDAISGLDYAVNRYYQSGMGRYLTPDLLRRSAKRAKPGSWNRYPYVQGDPINYMDRRGLNKDVCEDEEDCCEEGDDYCYEESGGGGPGGDSDPDEPPQPDPTPDPQPAGTNPFSKSGLSARGVSAISNLSTKCKGSIASAFLNVGPTNAGSLITAAALQASAAAVQYLDETLEGVQAMKGFSSILQV